MTADELERAAVPEGLDRRWAVVFELHPAPAVTTAAARLVASRARRAGAVLDVTFAVPLLAGAAPTWLPPVPVPELADVVGVADVAVSARDRWCYPSDRGTLVVPVERGGRGRLVALAVLQAHADPRHCEADGVLRSLDLRADAATTRALRDALRVHARRVVADLLHACRRPV